MLAIPVKRQDLVQDFEHNFLSRIFKNDILPFQVDSRLYIIFNLTRDNN